MINANELRIGNYVNSEFDGVAVISRLEKYGNEVGITHLGFTNYVFANSKFEPIPLTPEILEKCGFVRNNTACYFGLGNYYIHYQIKTSVVGIAIINDDDKLDADEELSVDLNIQYLHQLQNLYFALTGEELNYTP